MSSTYFQDSAMGATANLNALSPTSMNKSSLQSLDRLSRSIDRERDAEERFALQVSLGKKKSLQNMNREDVGVLSQGLGPEAKLKVFRRADNELKKKQTRSLASSKKVTNRVVVPKAERRRPRYCGGLTVCVDKKTGSDFNIGDAARAAQSSELQSTQAKWQLIGRFHAKWFQSDPNKRQFSYASLQAALSSAASINPDQSRISREQFISTTMLRLRDMNLAHRLYAALASQLDQGSHDSVPCLDILLPLVMLEVAQAGKPQADVLLAGLKLYEISSPPLTYANVMTVFQATASTRLERLELISRASSGFDFALRAAAAAAEMAQSVGGGRGGKSFAHTSAVSQGLHQRTKAYDIQSFENGNSGIDVYDSQEDEQLLNVGGGAVQSGLTPELVLEVLLEFPDLAADINRQMNARFLAAGRAVTSLAVLENKEIATMGAEQQGRDPRKTITPKGERSKSILNLSKTPTPDLAEKGQGRNIQEWVEVGIAAGDARKTAFVLPSYDDSDIDSEEEDMIAVRGV